MDWSKYDSDKSSKRGGFAKESQVTREAVSEVKDDDAGTLKLVKLWMIQSGSILSLN